MSNYNDEPKKSKGIGIIAIIASAIGLIIGLPSLINLLRGAILLASPTALIISVIAGLIAIVLARIVEGDDNTDDKLATIAAIVAEIYVTAIVACYVLFKFIL